MPENGALIVQPAPPESRGAVIELDHTRADLSVGS